MRDSRFKKSVRHKRLIDWEAVLGPPLLLVIVLFVGLLYFSPSFNQWVGWFPLAAERSVDRLRVEKADPLSTATFVGTCFQKYMTVGVPISGELSVSPKWERNETAEFVVRGEIQIDSDTLVSSTPKGIVRVPASTFDYEPPESIALDLSTVVKESSGQAPRLLAGEFSPSATGETWKEAEDVDGRLVGYADADEMECSIVVSSPSLHQTVP